MEPAMRSRRTLPTLTDSEGLMRAAMHFKRTSPSRMDGEVLTAKRALSDELPDSKAGDQQHLVNFGQPHVRDMPPLSSSQHAGDVTKEDQLICPHNHLANHRASATNHLDLYSQLS